jgi:hypothetical protein
MKISLPDDRDVGEAVGDSNEGMKEARDRYDARQKAIMDESMEDSLLRQNMISAGSDFKGRPQDEGYRPNAGTAMDRAMAEGAYDSGKITESGDQGFGGPGSSRTVKATPKAMPAKPTPKVENKPAPKPAIKAPEMPTDATTKSVTDRAKATRESARSGSGSTDSRSVNERIRDSGIGSSISNYFSNFASPRERARREKEKSTKMASGGMTSSASNRGDGIAQRGKTRGKMC